MTLPCDALQPISLRRLGSRRAAGARRASPHTRRLLRSRRRRARGVGGRWSGMGRARRALRRPRPRGRPRPPAVAATPRTSCRARGCGCSSTSPACASRAPSADGSPPPRAASRCARSRRPGARSRPSTSSSTPRWSSPSTPTAWPSRAQGDGGRRAREALRPRRGAARHAVRRAGAQLRGDLGGARHAGREHRPDPPALDRPAPPRPRSPPARRRVRGPRGEAPPRRDAAAVPLSAEHPAAALRARLAGVRTRQQARLDERALPLVRGHVGGRGQHIRQLATHDAVGRIGGEQVVLHAVQGLRDRLQPVYKRPTATFTPTRAGRRLGGGVRPAARGYVALAYIDVSAAAAGASKEETPEGAAVIYLIVGLDRETRTRWHGNVRADDATGAERIARARAAPGLRARRRGGDRAVLERRLTAVVSAL